MCLGLPGRIVEIVDAAQHRAQVDVDGVRREVSVAMLDGHEGARVGDWVLVHLGFAMARIDEAEARDALAALHELSDMYERGLAAGPPTPAPVVPTTSSNG